MGEHTSLLRISLLALTLLLASAASTAAPAPWYWWQSTSSGERVCAQVMTGQWQRIGGPFENSRCAMRAAAAARTSPDHGPAQRAITAPVR